MLFSFNYSCVAVISSISVVFGFGLTTGGPMVMTWSWLVGAFFTLMVGLTMAEICSTYPSAGSVYYWAGALAPEGQGPIYSFITGWFNLMGNAAACSGFAFGIASLISVSITIISGTQVPVSTMVMIAFLIILAWALLNIMRIDNIGWINSFGAVYQILSTLIIIGTVISVSQKFSSASFVYTEFNNETNINSSLYVTLIGMLFVSFSMTGYESGATMAEESKHASISAPKSIVLTCVTASIVGYIYFVGLLFGLQQNIAFVMNNSVSSNVVTNIFYLAFTQDKTNEQGQVIGQQTNLHGV